MAAPAANRSRGWVWAIAAIVLVVLAIVIVRASHPDVTVRTATVDRQNLISSISTNGKVEPTNDFQAHAPAPGQIQRLFVSLNQHVRKGQELLQLDASDAASRVASAQAGVTAAQTNLQNMEKGGSQDELLAQRADLITAQQQQQAAAADLNTREALLAKGDASPAEVAQARQRLSDLAAKVAQIRSRETSRYSSADLAATRAQVSQNRAALSAAESSYSGVDIHSPISGTVYSLPVAQYDYVQGGEALIDVADLTRLQVRAYFDEPEIGKLADGQAVTIKWDAKPDRLWHGHILQAPTTVTTYGTRNVGECLITVDDANGDLLPNTNVTVTVTTSQRFNVLSLPREALHTQGATNFVYKVVDGKLVRTPVQVGVVNLTRVEITSGLNQGDTIALGATTETDLTDGLKVKTQPQQ